MSISTSRYLPSPFHSGLIRPVASGGFFVWPSRRRCFSAAAYGQLQTIDRQNQIDLNVTARWGYRQSGGVMPGPGRIERSGAACRVFLNDSTLWEAVPQNVWEYSLGGHQVLKKWLSYRQRDVLGRSLRPNEAMEFTNNARRIAAILSLRPQLDDHYANCREATTE